MIEQKYIGVLHPDVQLSYLDFLFYDSFQLMVDKVPTNDDSDLLFSTAIIKPLKNKIDIGSLRSKGICHDIISELDKLEQLYWDTDHIFHRCLAEASASDKVPGGLVFPSKLEYFQSIAVAKDKDLTLHRMFTPKTQAFAILLSQNPEQKAIPILPENTHYYSKLVSGYMIRFMDIGIPRMPIRDLIKFKYDNQDKLRRLRLAISSFYNSHDDFASMLEEISLALNDYKKSVSRINRIYEISSMEFKFSFIDDLLKFLTTLDTSVFSKHLQIEKANIQKQIDIEAAKGSGVSYIHEVGELAKQYSSKNGINL